MVKTTKAGLLAIFASLVLERLGSLGLPIFSAAVIRVCLVETGKHGAW